MKTSTSHTSRAPRWGHRLEPSDGFVKGMAVLGVASLVATTLSLYRPDHPKPQNQSVVAKSRAKANGVVGKKQPTTYAQPDPARLKTLGGKAEPEAQSEGTSEWMDVFYDPDEEMDGWTEDDPGVFSMGDHIHYFRDLLAFEFYQFSQSLKTECHRTGLCEEWGSDALVSRVEGEAI